MPRNVQVSEQAAASEVAGDFALARAAATAMAGTLSPLEQGNCDGSTLLLSSPARRGVQAFIDPFALFSPIARREAMFTPAPATSRVQPTPLSHLVDAQPGTQAHPPLRPRVDDARNVARGVAAGGGAPVSSAAGRYPSQLPVLSSADQPASHHDQPTPSAMASANQPAFDLFGASASHPLRGSVGFGLGSGDSVGFGFGSGVSGGFGFGSGFVPPAPGLRGVADAPVNLIENFSGASANERRLPNTPPPLPVRPPSLPPGSSIFLRARRFRQHAVQACSNLDANALVGGIEEICDAIDNEVQERLRSAPPDLFEQEWDQAGRDMSAILAEATGSTPAAVADSLNASEGDPSISLLDLLHSKGNSFIENCAAAASSQLQKRRHSRSFQRFMGTYFPGLDPDSEEAHQALRANLTPEMLYRILGHSYRPGSNSSAILPPSPRRNVPPPAPQRPRHQGGGEEGEGSQSGEEDDYDDGNSDDGDDGGDDVDVGDKRKPSKSKQPQGEGRGMRVIKDPMMWVEGTAPTGGFELETFQAVYNDWMSVVSGLEKGCGCTFKSRIDHRLIPGIRGNLRLSPKEWDDIDDDTLIGKISKKLNFNHSDYYHSQFEVISMPYPPPDPMAATSDAAIATDYKVMTNRMLYILDQARKNGVEFRWSNVKRAYKKAIRGYLRLERLFDRKDYENLDQVVSYSNKKLKKRITLDQQKQHESDMRARAAGVRSDVSGGKSEPSEATPPRGRGGRGQLRGRGRGSFSARGGHSHDQAGVHKKDFKSDRERGSKDDAASKRLSQAYAKEDALPRGRYWHKRTPFCPAEGSCSAKYCQGCGYHGAPGNWHDRPKCRTFRHPDFVKDGYFHDKHPDKLNLFTDKSASLRTMMGETGAQQHQQAVPEQAHYRGASSGGSACQHCAPSSGDRSHSKA